MNLIIKPPFKRDRDKVSSTELLKELAYKLEQIESAPSLHNITGLKALTGYATHAESM